MREKLFDSEAKVMQIIWANSPISAKEISVIAAQTIGRNKIRLTLLSKNLKRKDSFNEKTLDLFVRRLSHKAKCRKWRHNLL